MGELIRKFTFGRNTLKRNPAESANAVISNIAKAEQGIDLQALKRDDNGAYNVIRDLISFSGVLSREGDQCRVTQLGINFRSLYSQNGEDAWRWLITRSLWRYVVPNGTSAEVNIAARRQGKSFGFFRSVLGLLWHLYALSKEERFLYYDEFCALFDDDAAWDQEPAELFAKLLSHRKMTKAENSNRRSLLGDLEDSYSIPRDNLNTVFNKAFQQTGLFEYANNGVKVVGIAISTNLDPVLQRRIRFILDHPVDLGSADWAEFIQIRDPDLPQELSETITRIIDEFEPQDFSEFLARWSADLQDCGLRLSPKLLHRNAASLLSKRFLILTGLAGSGKTKLGQALAHWLSRDPQGLSENDNSNGKNLNPHIALIAVGADWTGNENVLGYPNGLDKDTYISKPALALVLHARDTPDAPHFLILDEMNLSHVERYFADILSVIESEAEIQLYDGVARHADGKLIPGSVELPTNLFIIGTVNVDETTYMFSPKVLDRANVIEFRMDSEELAGFLGNPAKPDLSKLHGKGASYAKAFVDAGRRQVAVPDDVKSAYDAEMLLLFKALQGHGAEFGYRTAYEAARFIHFYKLLGNHPDGDTTWFPGAFDCVVFQKLLPKLHGSRAKLGPVLKKLWFLCVNDAAGRKVDALMGAEEAARSSDKKAEPSLVVPASAPYPLSAEKIGRMWRLLIENGFASFAEA